METLQQRLAKAKEALLMAGPRLVLLKAQTVLALVTFRVQTDGLVGKLYSNRDFPLFWFKDKELNARGKSWLEKKEKRSKAERKADPANWAGFRAAQGLPVAAVNLTYSGRMFRSLHATNAGANGTQFHASISASDDESADKVKWNIKRYGNFLVPLPSEAADADAAVVAEVTRVLKTVFQA